MKIFLIIIFCFILLVFYLIKKQAHPRRQEIREQIVKDLKFGAKIIKGTRKQVSGESYHYKNLNEINWACEVLRINKDSLIAHIIREPENPYDKNACSVIIGSERVGYLERAFAAQSWKSVQSWIEAGESLTCCAKLSGGGEKRNGENKDYKVVLILPNKIPSFNEWENSEQNDEGIKS